VSRYTLRLLVIFAAAVVIKCGPREVYPTDVETLALGKKLFARHCTSCHGIQHDGIGPPLAGVTSAVDRARLVKFVRDPARLIASGDQRFIALQTRYKLEMPAFTGMSDEEVTAILSFVHDQSVSLEASPALSTATDTALTGRLSPPIVESSLIIRVEDVITLPLIGTSTDLGIVTLRAHPSGDGSLFVGDQNGVIYRIRDGKAGVYLDIRKEVQDFQAGPGIATGVGSFDFHPDFLNNGLLYITHAETYKGQRADYTISDSIKSEVQWIIGEWKANNVNAPVFRGTHRELLRLHAPTFGHGCQEIAFIPGLDKKHPDYGKLYVGFGDGGSNNIKHPEMGHHPQSFLGAVLRIDPTGNNSRNGKYGIPSTNPFAPEAGPGIVQEIYAYGFRNPHRMAWDVNNDNRMIVADIGESNIEELNIVQNGGDYGWPVREGNYGINTVRDLKTVFRLSAADQQLYYNPFVQYDHEEGFAISGGYVYQGELSALRNKYIFGDIVNGRLFYANIDPDLSDSTIYEIKITAGGSKTNLREMTGSRRLHLRIAYDPYRKELFVITKIDGRIRRIAEAYLEEEIDPDSLETE
jgi:mono/diheme cytochrome c family protein